MKNLGKVSSILNIRIQHNKESGTISMDQRKYTEEILRRFKMDDCNPVKTPVDTNQQLSTEMSPQSPTQVDEMKNVPYREAVGSLLYLSQCTRPDISFAVGYVSKFNNQPGKAHWNAVKRIFRYLKGTIDHKLTFSKKESSELVGFCDSDWGSDINDRKSCSGYVFLWYGGAISWSSKKQHTVAFSTAEAEYMALSAACQETLWLIQLRKELIGSKSSTVIFCDNKSVIDLSNNPIYSARTKHIDIRHHFVRELIQKRKVELKYIETGRMTADNLTRELQLKSIITVQSKWALIVKMISFLFKLFFIVQTHEIYFL